MKKIEESYILDLIKVFGDNKHTQGKLAHLRYCNLYELNLKSSCTKLLVYNNGYSLDVLLEKFSSLIISSDKNNLYCNSLVSKLSKSLEATICFLNKRELLQKEKSIFSLINYHSDELLSAQETSYMINFVMGNKCFTSSSFMQDKNIAVIKDLSDSNAKKVSAYLYDDHWYLAFKDNTKIYVIDPNSESKWKFCAGHMQENISYVTLGISQSHVGQFSGICGKICIALKSIYPDFFQSPSSQSLFDIVTNTISILSEMNSLDLAISDSVAKLIKEDNPYYFELSDCLKLQTDYDSQGALENIIEDMDIQHHIFNKLCVENLLIDFTDPLGALRFNFMLQEHQMETPYLYRATHHNGTVVTIFGSMHNVPLSALPDKLREFLLSFDVLMSEQLSQEDHNQTSTFLAPDDVTIAETTNNREFPDWFDNMPLRVQQDLDTVFSTKFTRENVQYYLQNNNMIETLQQYVALVCSNGMDAELLSEYSKKIVFPLESNVECQATIMNGNEWIYNDPYDNVMKFIAQDHYDSNIVNGGAQMDNYHLVIEYLAHNCVEEDYDHTVAKRNKLWMANLQKDANKYDGNKKLLVGGCAHMKGKGGLIELLTESDFTIQNLGIDGRPINLHEIEAALTGDQYFLEEQQI